MCGIAGVLNYNHPEAKVSLLRRMLGLIRHRDMCKEAVKELEDHDADYYYDADYHNFRRGRVWMKGTFEEYKHWASRFHYGSYSCHKSESLRRLTAAEKAVAGFKPMMKVPATCCWT
jgi:hypothetical protein